MPSIKKYDIMKITFARNFCIFSLKQLVFKQFIFRKHCAHCLNKRNILIGRGCSLHLCTWCYLYLLIGPLCSALNLHFAYGFLTWLTVCSCQFSYLRQNILTISICIFQTFTWQMCNLISGDTNTYSFRNNVHVY